MTVRQDSFNVFRKILIINLITLYISSEMVSVCTNNTGYLFYFTRHIDIFNLRRFKE